MAKDAAIVPRSWTLMAPTISWFMTRVLVVVLTASAVFSAVSIKDSIVALPSKKDFACTVNLVPAAPTESPFPCISHQFSYSPNPDFGGYS